MKMKVKTIALLIVYAFLLFTTTGTAILLMAPPEFNPAFWIILFINILNCAGAIMIRLRLRKSNFAFCRAILIGITILLFFGFVYWDIYWWVSDIFTGLHGKLPDITEIWSIVCLDIEHVVLLLCNALCIGILAPNDGSIADIKVS